MCGEGEGGAYKLSFFIGLPKLSQCDCDGGVNRLIGRVRVMALSVCVGREKVVHMHVHKLSFCIGPPKLSQCDCDGNVNQAGS